MKLDPRRALVGLTMASVLIIAPPAVGYAVGTFDPSTNTRTQPYGLQPASAIASVMADNDNDTADDNGNVNDNDSADDNGNVNDNSDEASAPAAPAPAPAPASEPGANGQDDPYYQYHNDPNNN